MLAVSERPVLSVTVSRASYVVSAPQRSDGVNVAVSPSASATISKLRPVNRTIFQCIPADPTGPSTSVAEPATLTATPSR